MLHVDDDVSPVHERLTCIGLPVVDWSLVIAPPTLSSLTTTVAIFTCPAAAPPVYNVLATTRAFLSSI